jgi:hypothetical protein
MGDQGINNRAARASEVHMLRVHSALHFSMIYARTTKYSTLLPDIPTPNSPKIDAQMCVVCNKKVFQLLKTWVYVKCTLSRQLKQKCCRQADCSDGVVVVTNNLLLQLYIEVKHLRG